MVHEQGESSGSSNSYPGSNYRNVNNADASSRRRDRAMRHLDPSYDLFLDMQVPINYTALLGLSDNSVYDIGLRREEGNSQANVRWRGDPGQYDPGSSASLWSWNNNRAPRSSRRPVHSPLPTTQAQPLHPSLGFSRFASDGVDRGQNVSSSSRRIGGVPLSPIFERGILSNADNSGNRNSTLQDNVHSNFGIANPAPNLSANPVVGGPYDAERVAQDENQSNLDFSRTVQYAASLTPYLNLMENLDERVVEFVNTRRNWRERYPPVIPPHPMPAVADAGASYESESQEMEMEEDEEDDEASTGYHETDILAIMGQRKYHNVEVEPEQLCCICQEDYLQGEDLGKLDCGHEFHVGCITQWLTRKNSCPICKQVALVAMEDNYL